MKAIVIALLLCLPLFALAGPVLIPDGPQVTIEAVEPASATYVCLPGNPYASNAAGYYVFANGTANYSYAMLIDPAQCPTCTVGFAFTRVRTLLRLNAGATFSISAAIADVVDVGGGCYAPGAVQASSGSAPVSGVPSAGGYYISLNWTSPCIDPGRPYYLIFNIEQSSDLVVGPYIDNDGVTPCRVWYNAGTGWGDLSGGFAGDVFVWAETDCCSPPVGLEAAPWGDVKALFR